MIKKLWQHLTKKRRIQFFLLLILMLLASIMEVVSIGAVVPFLGALTSPESIFKYKLIRLALVDLLLLVVVLIFTIRAFYNIKPVAAYLLLPYLAWLGLAGYLNTYIVFNN